MKKTTKTILIISLVLLLSGLTIMAIGHTFGGRVGIAFTSDGITYPDKTEYYSKAKTDLNPFDSMDVQLSYADLSILPSDGYYVEYKLEGKPSDLTLNVSDGKLTIREKDHSASGFYLVYVETHERCHMNLYVPEDKYFEALSIVNDSGDVTFTNLDCGRADFTLDYGKLKGNTLKTESKAALSLDSGDVDIKQADVGTLDVNNDYGDVYFGSVTGKDVKLSLDSGDTQIDKLTSDSLKAGNSYGDIRIDSIVCKDAQITLESGALKLDAADLVKASLENDYGNIKVTLLPSLDDYDFDLSTDYGSVKAAGRENTHTDYDEEAYSTHDGKERLITAYCDSGDIIIK